MTRLLLDTHVLLWAAAEPDRLGSIARVLADTDTEVLVSAATTWELAIKCGLGRLRLSTDVATFVAQQRRRLDLTALAIRETVMSSSIVRGVPACRAATYTAAVATPSIDRPGSRSSSSAWR